MLPTKLSLFVLLGSLLAPQIQAAEASPAAIKPATTARILPIAGDGWAGSSVNVIAGLQNNLITDGSTQYAAFYAADATLVLARREIGSDAWTSVRTSLTGRVEDAHNTVTLAVDGEGYLHVAWDHHANPLNYARGIAPGSLELGPRRAMTGQHEDSVTYPAFLRLPDGDLLCLYRDGRSGRGNLVLNRYSLRTHEWTQVQANLIDGEGQRSAYNTAVVDQKGALHLAWVWRDSADVASNHDLCYARSDDGGATWTTTTGDPLSVPLTAANAEYAAHIGTNRSLMNPPSLAVDKEGHPYIANYWAPEDTDIPQYHCVHHDGGKWQIQQVTQRTTPFTLAGTNTKRPPLSRSVLFTQRGWRKPREVFLVYRDDERNGRIVVAECRDFSKGKWELHDLTASPVGAWEPSMDPMQWSRFSQLHLLVQKVEQIDGNDHHAATTAPTPVASLIWSPFLAGLGSEHYSPVPVPAAGQLTQTINASDVLTLMERAADWQLAQPRKYKPAGWENAPFYIGALALAQISPSSKYHDAILTQAQANEWKPAARIYDADDHCVIQAYAELHRRHRDPAMIAPSRERFDTILANPSTDSLDWGFPRSADRWSWCDALFMGPTSWLMLWEATGDERYLDFMNREWWATTDTLYVHADRLYARDQSFLDLRERNGRALYWSRGNGWVVAGLARVLDLFPKQHPNYPRYVALYREMMEAVLAAQQHDGLWRPGLLDAASHPAQETSGSSFYTFALAWGINRGLLDRSRFEPAARRAWLALAACVAADGKLEHVQPIGAAPEGFDPHNSEPFGVGAFLLAGSEIHRLVNVDSANP